MPITEINKIDFTAKNLTSNAGLFLLLENAKSNEIFDLVEDDLVFDNDSTNKIKMNHIKTMICGHFIGIDKLERLKLLQNDPLVNEFDISVKEPETVSRFLGNFTFKTTQMFRDINFKVFKKLLTKSKLTSITIDIDSSVINVEGHQEGASKGYNPKKLGNRCYNIQFAFCDELKAYVTGFVRSGNTYTANGASEMIKEIVANIKTDDLEILFRMDSGYFDEKIIETIESLGCKYLIFVEGLAEQLLLPIFAEKLGISLEDNHISIVNVNGRYFEHFIKLFNTDTSKFAIPKKVVCITDQDPTKKMKPEGNWEKCYSFEINLEKESYEYEVTSNKTLENLKELNKDSFYIATQKEGSTFEYEMLLENYKSSFFITESVANKELLREMIENVEKIKNKDDLLEEVNKFNKSKLRDLQIKYIENSEEDIQQKAKHIIASRYLASIGKGEVAQELATVLSNDMEFNVPSYIKEALEWLCKK